MSSSKLEIVNNIFKNLEFSPKNYGKAYAPSNIALVKYWGKRDLELNLPNTNSLSISLGDRGSTTEISISDLHTDSVYLNDTLVDRNTEFYTKLVKFLDLFRFNKNYRYIVKTNINIPVAAGVASSACGFAALVLALEDLFNWQLSEKQLSILARIGSGSAARSLWQGFVEWEKGEDLNHGLDSYAKPLPYKWEDLRVGLLLLNTEKKPVSSRDAMLSSVKTSPFYKTWPDIVSRDLESVKIALKQQDFDLLGSTSEKNAMAMHALMHTSYPAVVYSNNNTLNAMQKVWHLRNSDKVPVYFTQDAGPNIKLLFLQSTENLIKQEFPKIEIINPWHKR